MGKALSTLKGYSVCYKLGSIQRKEYRRTIEKTIFLTGGGRYLLTCVVTETYKGGIFGKKDHKSYCYDEWLTQEEGEAWIRGNLSPEAVNVLSPLIKER